VALTDLGRLYEAVAAFEAALKLNSDYASAHYNLGIVLARIGRYPEAIAAYQSALRLDPRSAETRLNLGMPWWPRAAATRPSPNIRPS